MADIIIMPKLGFNMNEGQLVKWHKAVGDTVAKGELLFEINTDKTTMPVEATNNGTLLAILLEEAGFADVFTPIGVLGTPGEDYSAALATAQNKSEIASAEPGVETALRTESRISSDVTSALKLTPKAKRLVETEYIDPASLSEISGTGYEGGITAKDIHASPLARKLADINGVNLETVSGSGIDGKIMKVDVAASTVSPIPSGVSDERKVLFVSPYKGVRKIIGDKLSKSKFTAPHLYFMDSVDTTNLTVLRKKLNNMADIKIAISDLLIMAAAKALKKYPQVNSSLVDGNIVSYKSVNVGTAVAGNNGLIVPVVKNVQEKSLTDVANETRDLFVRAKEGRLEMHEYSDGTFSISNLGMFGIENFTAIINGAESAILAVSSVRKKAVVIENENGEDEIAIRPMMNIQLSVDHRLIDGLLAAQFVGMIKRLLENPMEILI